MGEGVISTKNVHQLKVEDGTPLQPNAAMLIIIEPVANSSKKNGTSTNNSMALHTDEPNATALVVIVTSATATLATMYKAVSDMKHPDNKPEEGNWKGFTISYNMDSWTKDTTAKLSCLYTN